MMNLTNEGITSIYITTREYYILKTIQILLFFSLLIIAFASTALSEGPTLRMALDNFPPWEMLNENNEPTGIDVEFLEQVAERMGISIEYEIYPFKRALYLLKIGEADVMLGVLKRPEREHYLHFIEPPYKKYTHKTFYVLKGREHRLQKYEDLYKLRVGTRIGVNYYPEFDNDPKIAKEGVKSFALNLKKLQAGRVDTIISTETYGDYEIRKLGLDDAITKAPYAHREQQNVYMVISKESPFANRLEEFNSVVADLIREGTFNRIKEQFINSAGSQ